MIFTPYYIVQELSFILIFEKQNSHEASIILARIKRLHSLQLTANKIHYNLSFSFYTNSIMLALAPSSLSFKVRRCQPKLVVPAKATPHEVKHLSDIDTQGIIQHAIPVIQVYRGNLSMKGRDPVDIVRKALAETLVFYYPFAGRFRQGQNRNFMVECNGEGVVFVEADADVTVDDFGDIYHPIPSFVELIYMVPGTLDLLNAPLLQIQVYVYQVLN